MFINYLSCSNTRKSKPTQIGSFVLHYTDLLSYSKLDQVRLADTPYSAMATLLEIKTGDSDSLRETRKTQGIRKYGVAAAIAMAAVGYVDR